MVSRFALGTTGLKLSPFAHTFDKFLNVVTCSVQRTDPGPAYDQTQPKGNEKPRRPNPPPSPTNGLGNVKLRSV